jgi:hypothetical protein
MQQTPPKASRRTTRRRPGAMPRPAVQRRGEIPRCTTRSRCHRTTVPGMTIQDSWQAGTTAGSAPRTPPDPPTTGTAPGPDDAARRPRDPAPGSPHSSTWHYGPTAPAMPRAAARGDKAVIPPQPTIIPDGHPQAMPQATAVDKLFGTHRDSLAGNRRNIRLRDLPSVVVIAPAPYPTVTGTCPAAP